MMPGIWLPGDFHAGRATILQHASLPVRFGNEVGVQEGLGKVGRSVVVAKREPLGILSDCRVSPLEPVNVYSTIGFQRLAGRGGALGQGN